MGAEMITRVYFLGLGRGRGSYSRGRSITGIDHLRVWLHLDLASALLRYIDAIHVQKPTDAIDIEKPEGTIQ